MGNQKSKLQDQGYNFIEEAEKYIIAKKDNEIVFIKKVGTNNYFSHTVSLKG